LFLHDVAEDFYKIGDTLYGVFTTPQSEGDPKHPIGSAVCQFKMADIKRAFSGPFKKRMENAWRPYDPRIEDNIDMAYTVSISDLLFLNTCRSSGENPNERKMNSGPNNQLVFRHILT